MATKTFRGAPPLSPHPWRGVRYRVECADLHAHLFAVTLTIDAPAAQQHVSLPVWIPGSYLVREFAKNLQGLRATQGRRKPALMQLDKCSWLVECTPGQPLALAKAGWGNWEATPPGHADSRHGVSACSRCLPSTVIPRTQAKTRIP